MGIASDPSERVKLPHRPRLDGAMTIPTTEQIGKLILSADDSFQAFLGLCVGARLGSGSSRRSSR